MTNRHVFADLQPDAAGRVGTVVGDMQTGVVLHIAARADADAVDVAAHGGQRPDAAVLAQLHVADQLRGLVHPGALGQLRADALEGADQGRGSAAGKVGGSGSGFRPLLRSTKSFT